MTGTLRKRYTVADMLLGLKNSAGNISVVARRVGCRRDTVHRWLEKSPKVRAAFSEELGRNVDMAEAVVTTNVGLAARTQQRTQQPVDSADAWKVIHRADQVKDRSEAQQTDGEARREAGWASLAELFAYASDLERVENGEERLLTDADLDRIHELGKSNRPDRRSLEAAKQRIRTIAENQAKERRLYEQK